MSPARHTPPAPPPSPARQGSVRHGTFSAPFLALLLSACGGAGAREPYDGCPDPVSSSASFAPALQRVQAGFEYKAAVEFPRYPCINTVPDHCVPVGTVNVCTWKTVQGSCLPSLTLQEGPQGAWAYSDEVRWSTLRGDAGRSARFQVRANYPEHLSCPAREQAWTVNVDEAPPLPVLFSAALDRDAIRSGETVTVLAEFVGRGSWGSETSGLDFGSLESGVPATSPPLTGDQTLRVVVTNAIGEQVEARPRLRVTVWEIPRIESITATPAIVGGPTQVELAWYGSGTGYETVVTPTPVAVAPGRATVLVEATTTFTVTIRNPAGDEDTAQITVTVLPPPSIQTLVAAPARVGVGEAPVLTATFTGGTGVLEVLHCPTGVDCTAVPLGPVVSGVPFTPPPQRGLDRYRLTVTTSLGSPVSAAVEVPVIGPGSFTLALPLDAPVLPGNGLVALPDGQVVVMGTAGQRYLGNGLWLSMDALDVVDVTAGTVRRLPHQYPTGRQWLARLDDGRLVASGWTSTWSPAESWAPFYVLDLAAESSRGILPTGPGGNYPLDYTREGLVPLAGGLALGVDLGARIDLDAATWERASPLSESFSGWAPACRLADGRVLLNGGAALYDPLTHTVGRTAPLAASGRAPVLLCLASGSAVRLGGGATEVERYDPATGTWALVGTGPVGVGAAIELGDGRVLLVTPEEGHLLDPSDWTVRKAGRLTIPRDPARARDLAGVLLPDGRVVVHGASGRAPEVFTP